MAGLRSLRLLHILVTITYFVTGLVTNFVQAVLWLVLPRQLFHRANYYLVAGIYGYLVFLADWWGGMEFTIYCSDQFFDKLQRRAFSERQLVLVNHHTELDWLYCWQLADRGGLVGGCRALAKEVLRYIPVIGWSSYLSGDVFLSRSFEKDQEIVKSKLEAMEAQPRPTWLFVFPEGTRLNPAKLQASQEFAASRGLPVLQHHLTPRTKGFSLVAAHPSLHLEGGLMDLTFVQGPGSGPPSLQSLLTGRGVDTRVFVREFRLSEVPRGEAESGAWLHRLFREKDDIKDAFYRGDWDRLAQLGSFKPRSSPARVWPLVWTVTCNLGVLGPLLLLLLQGGPLVWAGAGLTLVGASFALRRMVAVASIKKE